MANVSSNENVVWQFLIGKGLTQAAAAGLMGNMQRESSFNPQIWGPMTKYGKAYGICQWLGSRFTKLQSFPSYWTIEVQLNYMWSEIESGAWITKARLNSQPTPADAAAYVEVYYEIAGNSEIPIRQQYANNIYQAFTGTTPPTITGSSSSQNGTINLDYSTSLSSQDNTTIPQTNYGIVAKSQKYGNILYGRKYRIIVADKNGNGRDVSNLRITFNIPSVILAQPQIAVIEIYNLNAETENWIIQHGARVVVEAGYEGELYGEIFDGNIIQPIRDKVDSTTYRLTLTALDGDQFMTYSIANFTALAGQTARSNITNLASKATVPAQLGTISSNLSKSALTRGKVVFGMTKDYLRQLAQSENAVFYYKNGKVHIVKAEDPPKNTIYDLSPTTGLVNVPTQSGVGISFQCMLNPNLDINTFVHIDNSLIREQQYDPSSATVPPRSLDQDGIYRIVSITFDGDNRGDNWYCDCTAVSQAGILPGNVNNVTGSSWGT